MNKEIKIFLSIFALLLLLLCLLVALSMLIGSEMLAVISLLSIYIFCMGRGYMIYRREKKLKNQVVLK